MKFLTSIACSMVIASCPVQAQSQSAALRSSADQLAVQHGTFVGMTFRLTGNGRLRRPRGALALGVGPLVKSPERVRIAQGVEYALAGSRGPMLTLAGRELGEIKGKFHLSSVATIALVAAGAAVVGGGVYVLNRLEEGRRSD